MNKSQVKITIALAIYLTALFASNTLGLKIMPFVLGTHLSVGIFFFPIVFIMTDVIGEVYGKSIARLFVLAGFVSTAFFVGFSLLALTMPWAEAGAWVRDSYDQVYSVSVRIAIASLLAFVIAEYQDVLSFFFFKHIVGKRFFWLRSNLSNLWSQFLDTTIFMTVAFLPIPTIPFLAEGYPIPVLISIIFTWWLYKFAMGALYTPLSYVGIWLLRHKDETVRK